MSALIAFILGILLALFGIAGFSAYEEGEDGGSSQTCIVSDDGVERCGPTKTENGYEVPDEGEVIHSFVHTGPVSPEFQAGYEIIVDADGTVAITETPLGASTDLAESERTADMIVRTEQIGEQGVQDLLTDLESCNFYFLPQANEFGDEDMPVGGSVSRLEVQLEDGIWEVSGALLDGTDATSFESCQEQLANRFGVSAQN
jgi:hypothetical protein